MAHANGTGGWTPGKVAAVAILVVIAVLAIIAGIMYLAEPARSLPSVLGTITHPASRAGSPRSLRGAVAIIVGVVLLAAAWLTARARRV